MHQTSKRPRSEPSLVPLCPALYVVVSRKFRPRVETLDAELEETLFVSRREAEAHARAKFEEILRSVFSRKELEAMEDRPTVEEAEERFDERLRYAHGGPFAVKVLSAAGELLLSLPEKSEDEDEEEEDAMEEDKRKEIEFADQACFTFLAINSLRLIASQRLPKDLCRHICRIVQREWTHHIAWSSFPAGGIFDRVQMVRCTYVIPTYDLYFFTTYRIYFGSRAEALPLALKLYVDSVDSCWCGGFAGCTFGADFEIECGKLPSHEWSVNTCRLFSKAHLQSRWADDDNMGYTSAISPASLSIVSYRRDETNGFQRVNEPYHLPMDVFK